MDFMELARSRRSIRDYSDTDIPREELEKCAEAARRAPSACNAQPWKFIIVDDREKVGSVAESVSPKYLEVNKFASKAKAFIVIVSEKTSTPAALGGAFRHTDFRQIDAGIACAHIVLSAWDMGIGTCVLGWFDENKIKRILKIPYPARVYLTVALGYPAGTPEIKDKKLKDASEVIRFNSY